MPDKKKILFLVPYPAGHAPSQRFRVELFLPHLTARGYDFTIAPFLDEKTYSILYQNASVFAKAWGVIKGFLKRLWTVLFTLHPYDYVFVHREASPVGPPVFEFLVAKVFRKKMIYDFDDAIWIPDSKNGLLNWFKAFWKIKFICKWAYKVAGGNEYLCEFAKQYNKNVVLMPTCVDANNRHNQLKDQQTVPPVIGWTGSHSTMKYLDQVVPLLQELESKYQFRFLVICNKPPAFQLKSLQYVKWTEANEVADLLEINIGIMPLVEDAWSKGKCGFKLIQYLSLGIPAVATPVGVNEKIIEKGVNGFLVTSNEEWKQALVTLLENAGMRKQMGSLGRKKMIAEFSIQANEGRFASLFD